MNVIKHFIIIVRIICSDKLNEPNICNLPINISTANTRIKAVTALILFGNNCIQNKYTFSNTSECLDKVIFRRQSIFLNSIYFKVITVTMDETLSLVWNWNNEILVITKYPANYFSSFFG